MNNKIKLSYTPSKNEFILLCGLAAVIIAAGFLNYLILPAWGEFTSAYDRYNAQAAQVETLKAEYASLNAYLEQEASLSVELAALREVIPSYLSEEEVICLVDSISSDSALALQGISFSGSTFEPRSAFLSSLKQTAASSAPASGSSGAAAVSDSVYIRSQRVALNYTGGYRNLVDFLGMFEQSKRQYYFRSASMTRTDDGSLTGALTLLAFSSGPASEKNDEYPGYAFGAPPPEGAADPFAAFPGYAPAGAVHASAVETPDFYIILNTYDDNANKILIGKYPISNTQISSNQNQNVSATLTLSSSGSEISYTYQLGADSYTGVFQPDNNSSGLSVNVLSRARKSALDRVGITLNVQNNTGKSVAVTVKNDDASSPRFILGSTVGRVQVIR